MAQALLLVPRTMRKRSTHTLSRRSEEASSEEVSNPSRTSRQAGSSIVAKGHPYRAPADELRERRERLRRELRDVEEVGLRHRLVLEELAKVERELDVRYGRRQLPVLDRLRIASPCPERWENMTGDESVRRCARCDRNVYDVSRMTEAEVVALLRAHDEPPCLKLYYRADGTVMTRDCLHQMKHRLRKGAALGVLGGLGVAANMAIVLTSVMGGVSNESHLRRQLEACQAYNDLLDPHDDVRAESPRPDPYEVAGDADQIARIEAMFGEPTRADDEIGEATLGVAAELDDGEEP
jgi:hypothetical protein